MKVEIRIYKRYDTDLVALVDNGYPVGEMMQAAIIGYANRQPVHFKLDEHLYFDMNRKTNVRLRFDLPSSEKNAIDLLHRIKHGYRNSFCKALLRESLSCQNLCCYFADDGLLELQSYNASLGVPNMVPVSALRMKTRSVVANYEVELPTAENYDVTSEIAQSPQPISTPSVNTAPAQPAQNKPPKPSKPQPEKKSSENVSANDLMAQFDSL